MIRNLTQQGAVSADADVLVIGAGTVGLVIAAELAKAGLKVICLESGAEHQDADEHPLNEVVQTRSVYSGAAHGRFRCLGGSSTRWGGALIPFLEGDLKRRAWPIEHSEILSHLPAVERLFGLQAGSYETSDVLGATASDYVARLAKWPPFAKRNVANLFAAEIASEAGPSIWLNATATDFEVENGRLISVTGRASSGSSITVRAQEIVLAAGAIETTRLLLLMDRQNGGAACAPDDQIGRYFHDHLSVAIGELKDADLRSLNRLIGFRFEAGGTMRNLRFELANESPFRETVPPHFVHIGFDKETTGGFDALRDAFRAVQRRRLPNINTLLRLVRGAPWLFKAVWWRFIEKRLLFPEGARLHVHMVIEQAPRPDNRISLSATRTDVFGQPLAEIDWSISEIDIAALRRAGDAFQKSWDQSPLSRLARFVRRPDEDAERDLSKGGGIYHPTGSTRMGDEPAKAVVDRNLNLFRIPNITVLSTSVLPNGGGANPTLMLLLLAQRSVQRLKKVFKVTE